MEKVERLIDKKAKTIGPALECPECHQSKTYYSGGEGCWVCFLDGTKFPIPQLVKGGEADGREGRKEEEKQPGSSNGQQVEESGNAQDTGQECQAQV
jgi:hypothetical protein